LSSKIITSYINNIINSLKQAMRLLEDQREKTPPMQDSEPKKEEPKGFFQRLFKG